MSPESAKQIEVILIDGTFKRHTGRFASEKELIEALKGTFFTHAPVSITYADGTILESKALDRINNQLHCPTGIASKKPA
jgi:hypothetical protein